MTLHPTLQTLCDRWKNLGAEIYMPMQLAFKDNLDIPQKFELILIGLSIDEIKAAIPSSNPSEAIFYKYSDEFINLPHHFSILPDGGAVLNYCHYSQPNPLDIFEGDQGNLNPRDNLIIKQRKIDHMRKAVIEWAFSIYPFQNLQEYAKTQHISSFQGLISVDDLLDKEVTSSTALNNPSQEENLSTPSHLLCHDQSISPADFVYYLSTLIFYGLMPDNTFTERIKNNLSIFQQATRKTLKPILNAILLSEKPSNGFELCRTLGVLDYVLPELLEGYGVSQNEFHKYDVYYHIIFATDQAPRNMPVVRFEALFHDIAKPRAKKAMKKIRGTDVFYNHEVIGQRMTYKILINLGYSENFANRIAHVVRHHMFFYTEDWTDRAVKRFVESVGIENLPELFDLRIADRLGSGTKGAESGIIDKFKAHIHEVIEKESQPSSRDLDISGSDLMDELGIPEGQLVGKLLKSLLDSVLNQEIPNQREILISKAKEIFRQTQQEAGLSLQKPLKQ